MLDYDVCVLTTIHPKNEKRIYQRCAMAYADFGFKTAIIAPWEELNPASNVDLYSTTPPSNRLGRLVHGYMTFVKAMSMKTQAFHVHDLDFLPWAVLLKITKRVSVIYDCHENYPEEILYDKEWIWKPFRKILSVMVRILENRLVEYLDYVVTVVPHQVKRFEKLTDRVKLIRNFSAFDPQLTSNYAIQNQPKNAAYFGSMSQAYGSYTFIKLIQLCSERNLDIHFYIAAKFSDEETKWEFLHGTTAYRHMFTLIESANQNQILAMSKQCRIGLSFELPSPEKNIAYPAKLFEYMKFGFALLSSNTKTNEQIIQDSNTGLICDAQNAEDYYDKLLSLLESDDKLNLHSKNSQKAAQSTYSWENEKIKLLEMLTEVLQDRRTTKNSNSR